VPGVGAVRPVGGQAAGIELEVGDVLLGEAVQVDEEEREARADAAQPREVEEQRAEERAAR